ncbi:hypothetical protein CG740_38855 [Streptomyces sp. CB01201]|nr:hypothetical protein CG740_38855 [Streptomyces sp. CB01201]
MTSSSGSVTSTADPAPRVRLRLPGECGDARPCPGQARCLPRRPSVSVSSHSDTGSARPDGSGSRAPGPLEPAKASGALWRSHRPDPAPRAFYDEKPAQGKHHTQALLCLARRRADVLFAMHHDSTFYEPQPSASIT